MVEGMAAESVKFETTAGGGGNQDLLYSNFQHIQNDHSHAEITGGRGPQGKHAPAAMKSALWTTKWLTFVFPWPIQVSFSQ